jgi:hypothetical protein
VGRGFRRVKARPVVTLVVKFVGLALLCCIAVKVLAAVVTPAIPVLAGIFVVVLVVSLVHRSQL